MEIKPDVDGERAGDDRVECAMCHALVAMSLTAVLGGRRLCFACAAAWFSDEDDPE